MRHVILVVLGISALLLFALPAQASPPPGIVIQNEMANEIAPLLGLPSPQGVLVTDVVKNGGADKAGPQFGIVFLNEMANEVAQLLGLPSPQGVLVMDVVKNGAADKAGLKRLDVLLEVAGRPVFQGGDLTAIVTSLQPGSTTQLRVWRDLAMLTLTVDVPAAAPPPAAGGVRGALGVRLTQVPLTPSTMEFLGLPAAQGAVVFEVVPDQVADKAGVKRLDVLLSLDGRPIATGADLPGILSGIPAGSRVILRVWRDRGYVQLTPEF